MVVDVQGKQICAGQKVARAAKHFQTDGLHVIICKVTKVSEDRVYLDDSRQPIKFPDRIAIVE